MSWEKSKKKQRQKRVGQGGAVPSLSCIEPSAAGIDVGATEIFVAIPQDRDPSPVRSFETFTEDLHRLKDWLLQHGIKTAAMESTGVYIRPLISRENRMSLPEGYAIRRATADDINTLVAHRRAMFVDMGYQDETALDAMAAKCRPWLLTRMNRGEYLVWLATAPDQSVVAGTGLWLMDWIPHMVGTGPRGNILNVYTEVEFRRRGLARELITAAMQWCRSNGVDVVVLHASHDGRGLYESMGFVGTNEMRINL